MGKQPVIHPGNDRCGSRAWKHLEIPVCALCQWRRSILHSIHHCDSHHGNTISDIGVWGGIQFQVIISQSDEAVRFQMGVLRMGLASGGFHHNDILLNSSGLGRDIFHFKLL